MRIVQTIPLLVVFILHEVTIGSTAWGQDLTSQLLTLSDEIKKAEKEVRYQGEQTVYAFSANKTFVQRFQEQYAPPYRKRVCTEGPKEQHFTMLEDGKFRWRYYPARKTVIKEPLERDHSLFPAFLKEDINLLKNNYRMVVRGPVPAGDVQCRIIEFIPKWADRPRREIWLEKRWKVPVRVYISSQDGRPKYTSELQKIFLNPKFEKDTFKLKVPKDTRVFEVNQKTNLSLEDAQRMLKRPVILPRVIPQGYVPYNIVLRMEGVRKRLQIVYSDGLSSFSVFQEATPLAEKKSPPAVKPASVVPMPRSRISQYGLMNVLTYYHSGYKTVFVGDIRRDRLLDIAESVSQMEKK